MPISVQYSEHDSHNVTDRDGVVKMTYSPANKKDQWPAFPPELREKSAIYRNTAWLEVRMSVVAGVNQCIAAGISSMFSFFVDMLCTPRGSCHTINAAQTYAE